MLGFRPTPVGCTNTGPSYKEDAIVITQMPEGS